MVKKSSNQSISKSMLKLKPNQYLIIDSILNNTCLIDQRQILANKTQTKNNKELYIYKHPEIYKKYY